MPKFPSKERYESMRRRIFGMGKQAAADLIGMGKKAANTATDMALGMYAPIVKRKKRKAGE